MQKLTLKNFFVLTAALALIAGPAFARTEGSLSGVVKDGNGEPLPGVSVKVESTELLGGNRTTTTDAAGAYRFPALPPGTYKFSAELFGFKKLDQEGLQVQINTPATFNPVLAVEGVEIGIEVRAHEDIVQPEKTQTSTALNNEFVDNIPVLGRAYQGLLLLAPGVVNNSGLGSGLGSGNVNSHGARADANQYLFDGGNTTDTSLGSFGSNFNQDAVDQIEVITAGYKAEYGRSDGLVSNVLTKSGGNDFEGSFRLDWRDDALDKHGSGKSAIKDREFYRRYYSATLGGPFVKDRWWFFASGYYQDRNVVRYEEGALFPVQDREAEFYDFFFKTSYQINDDHQLVVSWHKDPATIHNAYSDGRYSESYRNQQEQGGNFYLVKETAVFTPNVFLESLIYLNEDNQLIIGPDDNAPGSDAPFSGRYGSGPNANVHVGRYTSETITTRDRNQFREDLSIYIDDAAGTHDLKFGIGYELEMSSQEDNELEPFYRLNEQGLPDRKTTTLPGIEETETSAHSRNYSLYAQDSWTPTEGLTVNLGIRADIQTVEFQGFLNDGTIATDPNLTHLDLQRGIQEIDNTGVAPRLGLSYDITKDGKNVVRASASRFYTTLPGDSGEWERYSWIYGTYSCNTDTAGNCTSSQTIPDVWFVTDPNLEFPYTDEFTVGYEREVIPELAVGVNFIWREGKNLIQDIDINNVYTDTNGDGVPDSLVKNNENYDGAIYFMTNNDKSEYKAAELSVRKRLSDNWQILGSYTYSVAKGDGNFHRSPDGDSPATRNQEFSYSDFDQRHVVKVDGTYFLPLDFIVSASARYFSATPYSTQGPAFIDLNGNGIPDKDCGNDPPDGSCDDILGQSIYYQKNKKRNDDYFNLDLRAEKDFIFKGVTLGIFGDVFNVFNKQAVVDTTSTIFADGTGVPKESQTKLFGRQFQLGFRISF